MCCQIVVEGTFLGAKNGSQGISLVQIARNIAVGWAVFVVRIGATLLMTPFILDHLGMEDYGLWALIISIAAMLELIDFGTSNGLRRYYSQAIGRKDSVLMQSYLNAAASIFFGLSILIVAVSAVLSVAGPWIFDVPADRGFEFSVVMGLLGLRATVIFLLKPYGGVISAHERFDIIYGLQLAGQLVNVVLVVIVLSAGLGIVGLAVATLCTATAANIAEFFVCQRMYGPVHPKIRFQKTDYVVTLFSYSGITVIISICDYMRGHFNNVLVSFLTDLRSVVYYAIAFQLITYLIQMLRVVTATFLPRFSRLQAEGNQTLLHNEVVFGARISSSILVFALVMIWFVSEQFLTLWLDESFATSYRILQIMVPGVLAGYAISVLTSYLYATSKHMIYAKISVVEVIVDVAISIWLLQVIGVYGAAIGSAVAVVFVRASWLVSAACREMSLPAIQFVQRSYTRTLVFGTLFAGSAWVISYLAPSGNGWSSLILQVLALGVGGVSIGWFSAIDSSERGASLAYGRQFLRRRVA